MREAKTLLTARITSQQHALLKEEASRRGIAVGELLRRILDAWIEAGDFSGRSRA